jgi:hypothetical protein
MKAPQHTPAPPGTDVLEVSPAGDKATQPKAATAKPKKRLRDMLNGFLIRTTRTAATNVREDPESVNTPDPTEPADLDQDEETSEGAGPLEQLLEHLEASRVQPSQVRYDGIDSVIASARSATSTYARVTLPPVRVTTPSIMADYNVYREWLEAPDRPLSWDMPNRGPRPISARRRGRACD